MFLMFGLQVADFMADEDLDLKNDAAFGLGGHLFISHNGLAMFDPGVRSPWHQIHSSLNCQVR